MRAFHENILFTMLYLSSYDIVFQEIPGEVTLALNLADCPNRCPGCHSPHLQRTEGEVVTPELLDELLDRYGGQVTVVAFMGGDRDVAEVNRKAQFIKRRSGLKTAWYSGLTEVPAEVDVENFDFIKLGPYTEALGGLDSPTTNQRFYKVDESGNFIDQTALFRKK